MTTNIETAVGEIKQYANRELQLLNQKSEKQIALAAAEQAGGNALLDGTADNSIERAVRLQIELRQIDLAVTSCRARRLQAVQQKHDAEVQEFRQRAAAARQQATEIQAKTAPHLAALRDIEGVDHTPQGTPQSAIAANKAGLLDGQAAEMERRGIRRHGHIEVDSIFSMDEILDAVLHQAVDVPSAAEVIAWVESQPKAATFAGNSTTCRMSWDMTAGGILPASYVRLSPQPRTTAPPEAPVPANSQLRTPNQFFGHAAVPAPQETRG